MTENILAILFVFISKIISATGYAGIVILMAIESACIPLPSELIMPFAGYLVFQGKFNLFWAATAGAIGCNLGSFVAYEIGAYGGRPLVERYGRWILMGRRNRTHAAGPLPHLYLPGIMAVVLRLGLAWLETRRELARTRQVLPQIRCGNRSNHRCRRNLVCLEPLAE